MTGVEWAATRPNGDVNPDAAHFWEQMRKHPERYELALNYWLACPDGTTVAEARRNLTEIADGRGAEEPHHAAARQRTDEERAALDGRVDVSGWRVLDLIDETPEGRGDAPALGLGGARVGRWVVGQGWVPVDGRGPHERSAR